MSKRNPASSGPVKRPRLINELFKPIASPWSILVSLDTREEMDGRSMALLKANKPIVINKAMKSNAVSISRKVTVEPSKVALMTFLSPKRLVAGPVSTICTPAIDSANHDHDDPTSEGPNPNRSRAKRPKIPSILLKPKLTSQLNMKEQPHGAFQPLPHPFVTGGNIQLHFLCLFSLR